jgi:hypothetical protein
MKRADEISDNTLIMADIAQKAIRQVRTFVKQILLPKRRKNKQNSLRLLYQMEDGHTITHWVATI